MWSVLDSPLTGPSRAKRVLSLLIEGLTIMCSGCRAAIPWHTKLLIGMTIDSLRLRLLMQACMTYVVRLLLILQCPPFRSPCRVAPLLEVLTSRMHFPWPLGPRPPSI